MTAQFPDCAVRNAQIDDARRIDAEWCRLWNPTDTDIEASVKVYDTAERAFGRKSVAHLWPELVKRLIACGEVGYWPNEVRGVPDRLRGVPLRWTELKTQRRHASTENLSRALEIGTEWNRLLETSTDLAEILKVYDTAQWPSSGLGMWQTCGLSMWDC